MYTKNVYYTENVYYAVIEPNNLTGHSVQSSIGTFLMCNMCRVCIFEEY